MRCFEEIIVPFCSFNVRNEKCFINKLYGTAFFISSEGYFLTARHVIENALSELSDKDTYIGLCVKGKNLENRMASLLHYEYAPDNIDVAIGKIDYKTLNEFMILDAEISIWQDVATLGYPENALLNTDSGSLFIKTRAHKGYIQRIIDPNEISNLGNHKRLFELNFSITTGLSGSPLFTNHKEKLRLIGICTGSYSSEIVEFYREEIEENGTPFKEKRVKVEQFGIAQNIHDLLKWAPQLLKGETLEQILTLNNSGSLT